MHSNNVSHLLNERVSAVKLIAVGLGVADAVAASNHGYEKQNEAAITGNFNKAETVPGTDQKGWRRLRLCLKSKPSDTLRHYREMDRQILANDGNGYSGHSCGGDSETGPVQAEYVGSVDSSVRRRKRAGEHQQQTVRRTDKSLFCER